MKSTANGLIIISKEEENFFKKTHFLSSAENK